MEFTSEEKRSFAKLLKEPLSFGILLLCFTGASIVYFALKNYSGWVWLSDISIELPWVVLLVLVASRNRITPIERELLQKIANEHPDLLDDMNDQSARQGL